MKSAILGVISIFSLLIEADDKLTGRWETPPSAKGSVTGIIFHSDQRFESYVNRKAFTSGQYSLNGDVFTFTDTGCEGKSGTYHLNFFSNGDSLKLELIQDSCIERSNGIKKLVFGRVKQNP